MTLAEKYIIWREKVKSYNPEKLDQLYKEYKEIFSNVPVPIAWRPTKDSILKSNIGSTLNKTGLDNYHQLFSWSTLKKEDFWGYVTKELGIKFYKPYRKIIDESKGVHNIEWYKDAELNIVESCLQGGKDQVALIEGNESADTKRTLTYEELEIQVNKFASGLVKCGYKENDRIVFYLPLCLEAVIAYLGTIKAGLTVVSVADSFSPSELKKRIEITNAKLIITTDTYLYGGKHLSVYNKVQEASELPAIVLKNNPDTSLRNQDTWFDELIESGEEEFSAMYSSPDKVINILFSSGTTKEPKAIPWTQVTPIKAASDGFFHQDIKPGDVVTWTTGMGWMMAPWLIFASLINRATMALFNGAATGEKFGTFAEETGITILGTIPSIVKAWKKQEFHKKFNWQVRVFSSTGEPSSAEEYFYLMAMAKFNAPIIEYCGGTEIGGAYITGTVVQPASPGTFTTPALGLDFHLIKQDGKVALNGQSGEVYLIPPSPGLSQFLLNRDNYDEYYKDIPEGPSGEVLRKHGDAFEKIMNNGFIFYKSAGRTDDAMNIGGIKISAVEIEEVCNQHPMVFESAAVSVPGNGGGPEQLVIFVTPQGEITDLEKLKKELQQMITNKLNPLFRVSMIKVVSEMPRTASNKVMRRELRKLVSI